MAKKHRFYTAHDERFHSDNNGSVTLDSLDRLLPAPDSEQPVQSVVPAVKLDKNGRPVPPSLIEHSLKNHPEYINRKGRPKARDELRDLILDIGSEQVVVLMKEGRRKFTVSMSRLEKAIRDMYSSPNPAIKKLLLEYGFGKVPTPLDVTTDGEKISWFDFINSTVIESDENLNKSDDHDITITNVKE
jgi:hypothetical protein